MAATASVLSVHDQPHMSTYPDYSTIDPTCDNNVSNDFANLDIAMPSIADEPAKQVVTPQPQPALPRITTTLDTLTPAPNNKSLPDQDIAAPISTSLDAYTAHTPLDAATVLFDPTTNLVSINSDNAIEPTQIVQSEPMHAFAQLHFPDGDFYVNTHAVELGRDLVAMRQERRRIKEERRRQERNDSFPPPSSVKVEPDQDSNAGEHILNDIPLYTPPVPNLLRSVSRAGGIIGTNLYSSDDDDSMYTGSRKTKHVASTHSSAPQSIAPANLHNNTNDFSFTSNLFSDDRAAVDNMEIVHQQPECPFIPIHPHMGGSMSNISRKHVRIEYDGDTATWRLTVLGRNGVFVDDTFVFPQDSAVLYHGSKIIIQSIEIVFRLPENARNQQVADAIASNETAARSDSDNDRELSDSASDQDTTQTPSKQPPLRHKIKLTIGKRSRPLTSPTKDKDKDLTSKTSSKTAPSDATPATPAPVDAAVSDHVASSVEKESTDTPSKPTNPDAAATTPAEIPSGSILEGLAPEEIPQKRKGPGRPPKNGVMSKRDEAIIKRKKKELQKMGMDIPPLSDLLVMARAEACAMTTKKDKTEDGADEDDPRTSADADNKGEQQNKDSVTQEKSDDAPDVTRESQEPTPADAAKKPPKSPSPQQPETAYTEEQLKKPNKTYVILIHEALENSSSGIMDLQQIYDSIQKLYPYYKYRSQTQGWQSSIRHNLIGSEAFEEAGKIGKGRLWKINASHPIDKEKKRKVATPEPEKPIYTGPGYYANANGQFPYTNQGYPSYRPSPYGRPYGPPNAIPNSARPTTTTAQAQRPGTFLSPYTATPTTATSATTPPTPYSVPGRPTFPAGAQPTPAGAAGTQPPTITGATVAGTSFNPAKPNQPGIAAPSGPVQQPARPATQAMTTPQPGVVPPPRPTAAQARAQAAAAKAQSTPANKTQAQAQPHTPATQPPTTAPAPPSTFGWEATIEEIMSYNKEYLRQFKHGSAQQIAAKDLFSKAVYRYIDKDKDHGPFSGEEERRVATKIVDIISKNRQKGNLAVNTTNAAATSTGTNATPTPGKPTTATAQSVATPRPTVGAKPGLGAQPPGIASNATVPLVTKPGTAPINKTPGVQQAVAGAPNARPATGQQRGPPFGPPGFVSYTGTRPQVGVHNPRAGMQPGKPVAPVGMMQPGRVGAPIAKPNVTANTPTTAAVTSTQGAVAARIATGTSPQVSIPGQTLQPGRPGQPVHPLPRAAPAPIPVQTNKSQPIMIAESDGQNAAKVQPGAVPQPVSQVAAPSSQLSSRVVAPGVQAAPQIPAAGAQATQTAAGPISQATPQSIATGARPPVLRAAMGATGVNGTKPVIATQPTQAKSPNGAPTIQQAQTMNPAHTNTTPIAQAKMKQPAVSASVPATQAKAMPADVNPTSGNATLLTKESGASAAQATGSVPASATTVAPTASTKRSAETAPATRESKRAKAE